MVTALLLSQKKTITIAGAIVGLIATTYGAYRMIRTEDRQRLERMEAISLIVGGLFLTISALAVLEKVY